MLVDTVRPDRIVCLQMAQQRPGRQTANRNLRQRRAAEGTVADHERGDNGREAARPAGVAQIAVQTGPAGADRGHELGYGQERARDDGPQVQVDADLPAREGLRVPVALPGGGAAVDRVAEEAGDKDEFGVEEDEEEKGGGGEEDCEALVWGFSGEKVMKGGCRGGNECVIGAVKGSETNST